MALSTLLHSKSLYRFKVSVGRLLPVSIKRRSSGGQIKVLIKQHNRKHKARTDPAVLMNSKYTGGIYIYIYEN